MTGRRTHRRCYAILGALHEHGEMNATQLGKALHLSAFGTGAIYADLARLEEQQGLIAKRMAIKDGDSGRRMYWRIADEEQRRKYLRRRFEETEPVSTPRRRLPLGVAWQPGGAS